MKRLITLLVCILLNNFAYAQIHVPKNEVHISKKDTLVWVDTYKSLIFCHDKGKRESIYSVKTEYTFNIDTFQFVVEESKNDNLKPFINSAYFSFVDLDIFGCYLHIYKKEKKTIFSKTKWEHKSSFLLPPLKSGLSGFLKDAKVNIVERISLLDVFTAKVIYTNGKEETYTYDEKSKAFNKSN